MPKPTPKPEHPQTSRNIPKRPAAPRIIAFAGQKGGAGKTTGAISVAAEWYARRRRVLLVDTDPQGSARTWAEVATETGAAAPTVVAMGRGLHQPGQLPALSADHDVTVVDCPPRLDDVQRAVLMVANLVLIPCGPSTIDAWSMAESLELVRKAQAMRPELKAAILITRKQPKTTIGQDARKVLEGTGLPVLAAELAYRVIYQEAPAAGQGPTTYAPKSAAAAEVRALVDELESRLWA